MRRCHYSPAWGGLQTGVLFRQRLESPDHGPCVSAARSLRGDVGSHQSDAFDAGFILGLLEGWDLRRTIEFASAIGASACTQSGCTAGVFTRDEAVAFLAQNHIEISDI